MTPLPFDVLALLAGQGGAVAGRQLRALGRSRADVERWLRNRQLVRAAPDTFVDGASWRLAGDDAVARHGLLTAAALVRAPEALASHRSAALIHGLPILGAVPSPEITRPPSGRTLSRTRTHRVRLMPEPVTIGGLPVTGIARTCIDVARGHGTEAGLAAADAALAIGQVTVEQLRLEARNIDSMPGARAARTVAGFADARAESPLESVSRWRLHQAGVEPPVPQVRIWIDHAEWRVDFCWPQLAVVGEADGRGKYRDDPDAFWREKVRHRELERAGFVVVRWFWRDTKNAESFEPVARQLRSSFSRQAQRARPLVSDHAHYSWDDLHRDRE